MEFFKDWIFKQLPRYHQVTDTYQDKNGDGLLKRYLRSMGIELDDNFIPYIDNFLGLVDVINCDDKYLPLLGSILGYPPSINGLNPTYRKVLAYAIAIYKIKGTLRSFQILFNLLGLEMDIIEELPRRRATYDADTPALYDDNQIYDSECEYCSGYYIQYNILRAPCNSPLIPVDPLILGVIQNIVCFLNPINANFLGLAPRLKVCDDLDLVLIDYSNFCSLPTDIYVIYDVINQQFRIFWFGNGEFEAGWKLGVNIESGDVSFTNIINPSTGMVFDIPFEGQSYLLRLRRKCSNTSFSSWVYYVMVGDEGIFNSSGFTVNATELGYIINSPEISLLTDYHISLPTLSTFNPVKIVAIQVNGIWIETGGVLVSNITQLLNLLNSLGKGTFFNNPNEIISIANPNVLSKIAFIDPTDNNESIINFFQFYKRVPQYPDVLMSDYTINIDLTIPIIIFNIYIDDEFLPGPVPLITNITEFLDWINGLGKGIWQASGNTIYSIGNTHAFNLLSYDYTHGPTYTTLYFNQRNVRINTGDDKLLLTDYSMSMDLASSPIVIDNIIINGLTLAGSGSTLNSQHEVIDWLNTLNKGLFVINNDGDIESINNKETFDRINYHYIADASNELTLLFNQFNQKVQNFTGALTTIILEPTEILNDMIYVIDIPPNKYDKIYVRLPIDLNPIPITGGLLFTDTGFYPGFIEGQDLVFVNITLGELFQIRLT